MANNSANSLSVKGKSKCFQTIETSKYNKKSVKVAPESELAPAPASASVSAPASASVHKPTHETTLLNSKKKSQKHPKIFYNQLSYNQKQIRQTIKNLNSNFNKIMKNPKALSFNNNITNITKQLHNAHKKSNALNADRLQKKLILTKYLKGGKSKSVKLEKPFKNTSIKPLSTITMPSAKKSSRISKFFKRFRSKKQYEPNKNSNIILYPMSKTPSSSHYLNISPNPHIRNISGTNSQKVSSILNKLSRKYTGINSKRNKYTSEIGKMFSNTGYNTTQSSKYKKSLEELKELYKNNSEGLTNITTLENILHKSEKQKTDNIMNKIRKIESQREARIAARKGIGAFIEKY